MAGRVSKKVDASLREKLLHITEKDITSSFIYDLFGEFNGVAKCNPYDLIDIPPGAYGSTSFLIPINQTTINYFISHENIFSD